MSEPQGSTRRGDIQGLRAIAVLLVIGYHAFPTTVPGGYVGVDVFFVISGFLISGLLLREMERSDRIDLPRFYARRLRRLLPAALTVTLATLAAATVIASPLQLVEAFHDAAWSTVSLANVHFAMEPGGYFATGNPSYFLHFWSLSVEEQFYLVWPLLIIIAARSRRKWGLPLALGVVISVTFAASIHLTAIQNPQAYYSLGVRGWELGIGAGLAWLTLHFPSRAGSIPRTSALLVGAVGVFGSGFLYNAQTPFPGWTAAVPTLGAALMIWAGTGANSGPIGPVLGNPVARYVGDISYSLYLWHWPALIIGTQLLGSGRTVRLALVALTLVLAAASYHFIEQAGSRWRLTTTPRTILITGAATALAVSGGAYFAGVSIMSTGNSVAAVPGSITSFESAPLPPPQAIPANVVPRLDQLKDDLASVFTDGCFGAHLTICEGGDRTGKVRIVLAGDSHTGQWWPAVDAAARERGWHLYLVGKQGCALVDLRIPWGATSDRWPDCETWQPAATDAVANLRPDLIIWANNTLGYRSKVTLRRDFEEKWELAATTTLRHLTAAAPVLMLGQTPRLLEPPDECLAKHIDDVAACAAPLVSAVPEEIRALNQRIARAGGATLLDPSPALCGSVCAVLAGNNIVYRDSSHLTATYALLFTPAFIAAIDQGLR